MSSPYDFALARRIDPFECPPTDAPVDNVVDACATVHDAGAIRTPPWMAVVAALATVRPDSIGATIDWLVAHRGELERAYAAGEAAPLAGATLPPEMHYEPELGGLDRTRDDHALRDRYLFADCAGKRSFFQTAVYAMTGLELSACDAEMLDAFGSMNLLVDRRAWPMAVTRRIAARGGGYAAATLGGAAMMGSSVLAGAAAANCARFLVRAREAQLAGTAVSQFVGDALARREYVRGFGRPVVGPDERVPVIEALLRRYNRSSLPFVSLLRGVDAAFFAHKGLRSTAAAWAAAVLLDFGMSPDAVHAVSNYWVNVCLYAQALFSGERGVKR